MNGNLAHLGAEHKALYADKVAYVKKFLEHYIVQVLVLSRAKVIAAYINLNTAFGVLKLDKRSLAHDTAAHYATGNAHVALRGIIVKRRFDSVSVSVDRI